jgi:hypothetical protein
MNELARPGFNTVTPRIVTSDVPGVVAFLREVFDATGDSPPDRPAEMRIGDSLVMVSGTGERDAFPAFLYVYVADADTTYRKAPSDSCSTAVTRGCGARAGSSP